MAARDITIHEATDQGWMVKIGNDLIPVIFKSAAEAAEMASYLCDAHPDRLKTAAPTHDAEFAFQPR